MITLIFQSSLKIGRICGKGLLQFLIFSIEFYQLFLSFLFPSSCKYYPTCSEYAKQSLKKYGIIKGGIFSIIRIVKCNPFSCGGIELVD